MSNKNEASMAVSDERLTAEYPTLREANQARQIEWDVGNQLTLAYRGNEFAGEAGEVCNVIKKLERERMGIRGSRDTVEHLAEELADTVICADLIAMSEGIDLNAAVAAKFNATSEKVGLRTRLAPTLTQPQAGEVTEAMVDDGYAAFVGASEWQDWDEDEIKSLVRAALLAALQAKSRPESDWQLAAFDATLELAKERGMAAEGREGTGFDHQVSMRARITSDFSRAKLGRWLGWTQACVVAAGCASLEEMKLINKAASDAAKSQPEGGE